MLKLDHLAICAETLAAGAAVVKDALGVAPDPGGEHPAMGTHNRLLHLGTGLYLEVIAINPAASPPGRARWFDLDNFRGRPRLTNWVVRTPDLYAALARLPAGTGAPMTLARGDLKWRMAVPGNGRLPFDGACPAVIEWQGAGHPSARLPERGCRLTGLEIAHPDAAALRATLHGLMDDPRVEIHDGAAVSMRAHIETPTGPKVLE